MILFLIYFRLVCNFFWKKDFFSNVLLRFYSFYYMTLLLWWFVAKVFSEPYQTHKMEFFVKLVNGLAVNYFRKKLHLSCLTWFWILLHLVSLGKIHENAICRNCLAKLSTDVFMDFLHWVKLIQKIFEFFIFFLWHL